MKLRSMYMTISRYPIPLLLCSLALIIWFCGSYVTYHNQAILIEPQKRFYIILLIFLCWTLKLVLVKNPTIQKIDNTPEESRYFEKVQQSLLGALKFLKKTFVQKNGKNINLYQLPWHLFVGVPSAGKSSLFANAQINYVLAKQFKQNTKDLLPSDNFDWWVTRDLVFIDVPSKFTVYGDKKNYWNYLVEFIKKNHWRHHGLQGVSIAINIPELLKEDNSAQKKLAIQTVKKIIQNVKTEFGPSIGINFVITKCDLIPGFKEFFAEMSSEEIAQTWGISLPALKSDEILINVFASRFNILIKRLNKQVIWRLHHERDMQTRALIKDFPLQIERLKQVFSQFLKALNIPVFNLQAVHLTSALQQEQIVEKQASTHLTVGNNNNQNSLQILQQPPSTSKTFFIKQFLLNALPHLPPHEIIVTPKIKWIKRVAFSSIVTALTFFVVILGIDFEKSMQQSYSLQGLLTQYQLNTEIETPENQLLKALPLLNALQTASQTANQDTSWHRYFSFYSYKSKKAADAIYQEALQTIVLPKIKTDLEKYLADATTKNPINVYEILKAYLMLNDVNKLDAAFLTATVTKNLFNRMTPLQFQSLMTHIRAAVVSDKIRLNNELITNARQTLLALSRDQLAWVILKNLGQYNQAYVLNMNNHPAFHYKTTMRISNLYTANYFQDVVNNGIPQAAQETLQGNFVLGVIKINYTPAEVASLTASLNKQYVSNYTNTWQNILNSIDINNTNNLIELNSVIADLTSNESPLIQLLKVFQVNTAFSPINANNPSIQNFNTLITQPNLLYQVFVTLKQFQTYLDSIIHSPNLNEAAFNAAKARMDSNQSDAITQLRNTASQCPEPIKTWLRKIANRSWHYLLMQTGDHIQANWEMHVYPMYAEMMNGFPFKADSNMEVDINSFANFMGRQGSLDSFYQKFIKPFVCVTDKDWEWKQVDRQQIAFANDVLQTFEHAERLRQAFFPNGDNKLSIPFSLEPLSENAKSFNLVINGQPVPNEKSSAHNFHALNWPGNPLINSTILRFVDVNHHEQKHELKGEWGWFRLVNQSTDSIISRKEIVLAFNINKNTVKYTLYTQSPLNPFVPINLHKLQFPAQLMVKLS